MDVKEKFYYALEKELMPDPIDDVEAFLNCARYNDDDDGKLLREYLEKYPEDIDARDAQGRTAVHMAAANGHMNILEMLCAFSPAPDVPNHEGNTALHFAALNNRVAAARLLIGKGWKASATNVFGRTPLQLIQGKKFEEMEALLLEHDDSLDSYAVPMEATRADESEAMEEDLSGPSSNTDRAAGQPPNSTVDAGQKPPSSSTKSTANASGKTASPGAQPAGAKAAGKAPASQTGVLGTTTLDEME